MQGSFSIAMNCMEVLSIVCTSRNLVWCGLFTDWRIQKVVLPKLSPSEVRVSELTILSRNLQISRIFKYCLLVNSNKPSFCSYTAGSEALSFINSHESMALLDLWLGLYNRIHFFAFREAETLIGLTYKFCLSPNTQENRQFHDSPVKNIQSIIQASLLLINPSSFANWFAKCCYCTP